jgi:hypothetical protein
VVARSQKTDPYTLLGVARGADDAALKAAYRTRIRSVHPDLVAMEGPEAVARAEAQTQALNEAYEIVKRDRGRSAAARVMRPVGTVLTAHEALRLAKVAVGHAATCVKRWRNYTRALRKARAAVLAEQARMGTLPGAALPPEGADAAVYAAASAVASARLVEPILAVAAVDLAAAQRRFEQLEPAKILAVAAQAEAAARAVRDRICRDAGRAEAALRRLAGAGRRAETAGREARRAAQTLGREVEAARASVEAAVVAAARAAGLAGIEAAAADAALASRRNVERGAALVAEATRLEREQLVGEEEAASAQARAQATIAAARTLAAAAAAPEAADAAWQLAARAARRAMVDVLERVMAEAEAQVRAGLSGHQAS